MAIDEKKILNPGPCENVHCGCPITEHDAIEWSPYVTIFLCRNGCDSEKPPTPETHWQGRYICGVAVNAPRIRLN